MALNASQKSATSKTQFAKNFVDELFPNHQGKRLHELDQDVAETIVGKLIIVSFLWPLLLDISRYVMDCVKVSVSCPNLQIVFEIAQSGFEQHRHVCIFVSIVHVLLSTIMVISCNQRHVSNFCDLTSCCHTLLIVMFRATYMCFTIFLIPCALHWLMSFALHKTSHGFRGRLCGEFQSGLTFKFLRARRSAQAVSKTRLDISTQIF